jgi:hypothetical protein
MNVSTRTNRLSFIGRVTAVAAVLACLACAERVQAQSGPTPDATGRSWDPAAEVPPVTGTWELFITDPSTPLGFKIFMWDTSHLSVFVCTPFGIGPDGVTIMFSYDWVQPNPDGSMGFFGRGRMNITPTLVALSPSRPGVEVVMGNFTQTFDFNDEPIFNQTTLPIALSSP